MVTFHAKSTIYTLFSSNQGIIHNTIMFSDSCKIEFGATIMSLGTLYEARLRGVPGGHKLEITNQIHHVTRFDT